MEEAIGRYWDDYYFQAERLAKDYASSVRVFNTEALRTRDGQSEILEFCGFEEPRTIAELQLNKGSVRDGVGLS
jgi:hypothetical protein